MARLKEMPVGRFIENMKDVKRLLEIHEELTGAERGRRYGVEVLNKGALVLITACWEAVVEDIASQGFEYLLANAKDSSVVPNKVRALASNTLRTDPDETKVWELADSGWKNVLTKHKTITIAQFVDRFNTPKSENVDRLFETLLGIRTISSSWAWQGTASRQARKRLDDYITDRGAIAHRVSTTHSITKAYVQNYRKFTYRLAVKTSNKVNAHLKKLVGRKPWADFTLTTAH